MEVSLSSDIYVYIYIYFFVTFAYSFVFWLDMITFSSFMIKILKLGSKNAKKQTKKKTRSIHIEKFTTWNGEYSFFFFFYRFSLLFISFTYKCFFTIFEVG